MFSKDCSNLELPLDGKNENYGVLVEKIFHLNYNINNLSKRIDEILTEDKGTADKLDELKIDVEKFKSSAMVARTISGGLLFIIGALIVQLYAQNNDWNKAQDTKAEITQGYVQNINARVTKIEFMLDQQKK